MLTDMELLAMLLAAIVHDVGHDGMNNNYHKNALTDRAIAYNDQSIQENYHLGVLFESMKTHADKIDVFAGCERVFYQKIREMIIHLVLHTDMSKHFVALKEFKTLAEERGSSAEAWKGDMLPLMAHVLHSCDISNPAKPTSVATEWTDRCLREFFHQGDVEKGQGLPISALCDRESTPVPDSQIGFIQFVVLPTYQALATVLPQTRKFVQQLNANLDYWEQKKAEENPDETGG
jgi:hypothetical protein